MKQILQILLILMVKVTVLSLSRALFSETLKFHLIRNQLKANFIWSLNKLKGMKVYTNELGHMTSMAAMPIYGKNR